MLICLFDSNLVRQPAACTRLMSSCLICLGMYCYFLGVGSFVPLLNGWMASSPLVTLWTLWMTSPVTPNAHFKKNPSASIPDILSHRRAGRHGSWDSTQTLVAAFQASDSSGWHPTGGYPQTTTQNLLNPDYGDFSLKKFMLVAFSLKPFSRITLLITIRNTIQYKIQFWATHSSSVISHGLQSLKHGKFLS